MPDNLEDDLRPEYDLSTLKVRELGPGYRQAGRNIVKLEDDVAEVFKTDQAVNEVLRFLIHITRENKPAA